MKDHVVLSQLYLSALMIAVAIPGQLVRPMIDVLAPLPMEGEGEIGGCMCFDDLDHGVSVCRANNGIHD